jgi:hypothetical protein
MTLSIYPHNPPVFLRFFYKKDGGSAYKCRKSPKGNCRQIRVAGETKITVEDKRREVIEIKDWKDG